MRLAAVATAKNHDEILRALRLQARDGITDLVTFGSRSSDYKASSLLRMTLAEGTRGHLFEGDTYDGLGTVITGAQEYESVFMEALDTLQRGSAEHHYRPHDLKHPDDYGHYVAIVADRLAALLRKHETDTVLFFDVPHLFLDNLLYRIARGLGLKTLILRVAFLPDTFFSMERIEDLGHLASPATNATPLKIDRSRAQDLYYMKDIGQERAATGRLSRRAVGQFLSHVIMREPRLLLRPDRLVSTLRRMDSVMRRLPDWRDPFARFFGTESLAYAETIAEFEEVEVDLERPFVYFAMQLQPEMTTSILGGRYRDQALAIEHLAAILPDTHLLYVKENPKQASTYRSPMFFHRLRRIPQVQLLPSHANTHALTRAADFVATISGTVAWEAVCAGRPALLFGESWMQDLPGVFRFHSGLRFEEIAAHSVDHEILEQEAGKLMAAGHKGILTRHVARLDPDHDSAANAEQIAETLWGLLQGKVPYSFRAQSETASSSGAV